MKNLLVGLLLATLAACRPTADGPSPPLRHQYDAAYQQQAQLLQADNVDLQVTHPEPANPKLTVLALTITNPQHQPAAPDSLRQRARKLAHLAAADLVSPADFAAMNVQIEYRHGLFAAKTDSSQTFIFPLKALR